MHEYYAECEKRAVQLQQERKTKEALRVMKHISLVEEEIKELQTELSAESTESTEKTPIAM